MGVQTSQYVSRHLDDFKPVNKEIASARAYVTGLGYFEFYVAIILVLKLKTRARKITAISLIYAVPILMNIFGKAVMHWRY